MTSFHAASGYCSTVVLGPVMPALQTSASMRLSAAVAAANAAVTSASRVTSTAATCVPGPSERAAVSSAAASRSHRLTRAPDATSRCAIASPMPAAPPVTMAARPCMSSWFIAGLSQ